VLPYETCVVAPGSGFPNMGPAFPNLVAKHHKVGRGKVAVILHTPLFGRRETLDYVRVLVLPGGESDALRLSGRRRETFLQEIAAQMEATVLRELPSLQCDFCQPRAHAMHVYSKHEIYNGDGGMLRGIKQPYISSNEFIPHCDSKACTVRVKNLLKKIQF
jgi:hypothetical protein